MRNPALAFAILLSCTHTPQEAKDAEKIGSDRARSFCDARPPKGLTPIVEEDT